MFMSIIFVRSRVSLLISFFVTVHFVDTTMNLKGTVLIGKEVYVL